MKAWPLIAALAFSAAPVLAAAQAPLPARSAYKPPRTPDGHPDLQGTWTNASLTRLERDGRFSALILSEAQAAEVEGRNQALVDLGNKRTDPNATVKDLPSDCSDGRGDNCNYNAGWTDPGTTVMRVAGKPRSSFITSTPDGRVPPLLPEARARTQAAFENRRGGRINDNPETRALGERCLLSFGNSAGPVMLPLLYNNIYQIVQTRDHVAIEVEMVHDIRDIRLGAQSHLPPQIRPWMGDSIGRWDGDTLVIETTNYHPQERFRGASEHLKVTERLTRVAADRVHYGFWVEDPTVFSAPWGGEYEFSKAGGALYEYACHEGNYALPNILAGARAEEQAAGAQATDAGGR